MDIQNTIKSVGAVYSDSIDGVSIRLLRISQLDNGVFVGKLKTIPLASAPHFNTVSYVWGDIQTSEATIHVDEGELPILKSLVPFLHMVTRHEDFKPDQWWWIDSLCINLADGYEREQQIRIMADIYKSATKAVIWLGEEKEPGSDCVGAIDFLHHLAGLQVAFNGDDRSMRSNLNDPEFAANCAAVSNLLFRPWWTRVWTLQEFVLPKGAMLYCGTRRISRGKFKSAIYSIFLCSTISHDFEHELVPRKAFDGAFNRRRIHQLYRQNNTGMSLVAILAYLGNHAATDSRDRIFSVLGLVSDRDRKLVGAPEYTSSVELHFAKLVRSFWLEYGNLDIICFVHLFSRYSVRVDPGPESTVPSWVPDWRAMTDFASPVPLMASQSGNEFIGNFRPLGWTTWNAVYDAPGSYLRKFSDVLFSNNLKELSCNGVVLGQIHGLGGLDDRELRCHSFICAEAGHRFSQTVSDQNVASNPDMSPMDWLEGIAHSLLLGRKDKYLCFHTTPHYTTDFISLCHKCLEGEPVDWSFANWFEHNRDLRFGSHTLSSLVRSIPIDPTSSTPPVRQPSYPWHQSTPNEDKLETFLSRFHDTIRKKARRLMVTDNGLVGMGPCRAREGDVVVVLGACSIPLVLRITGEPKAYQVIGEAYLHGYMNGEASDLVEEGRKGMQRIHLV